MNSIVFLFSIWIWLATVSLQLMVPLIEWKITIDKYVDYKENLQRLENSEILIMT